MTESRLASAGRRNSAKAAAERIVGDGHLGRGAALVGDIVGWIDEAHVRQVAGAKRALHVDQLRRIAAQQAVHAAAPEVAGAGDGHRGRWRRLVGIVAEASVGRRQQPVELHAREAEHIQVDHRLVADARDLGREQRLVPAGVQRDLVVGQAERPRLRRGEMAEPQHRHRGSPAASRP